MTVFICGMCMSTPAHAVVVVDSITKVTNFEYAYPCWSPDGTQLVLQANVTGKWVVYTMNADGSGLTPLTAEQDYAVTPSWSPDGSQIAYVSRVGEGLEDIWTMNPDGTGKINVTNSPDANESHPHWSPDSRKIIYNTTADDPAPLDEIEGGYGEEVYEMNADGSNPVRLTHWNLWDTYASYSPDGSRIVFRRLIVGDTTAEWPYNSEIFVMNRDGSNATNISNYPGFDGYPMWSPDGAKIIYVSYRDGVEQLYTMNPDGSEVQQLAASEYNDVRPNWSRDGSKIAFNRERGGSAEIHILHLGR